MFEKKLRDVAVDQNKHRDICIFIKVNRCITTVSDQKNIYNKSLWNNLQL